MVQQRNISLEGYERNFRFISPESSTLYNVNNNCV